MDAPFIQNGPGPRYMQTDVRVVEALDVLQFQNLTEWYIRVYILKGQGASHLDNSSD